MTAEILPMELPKPFLDSLLQDEQLRGHYTQKNFVILFDKILNALQLPLLQITLEEEISRRSTFSKLDKWLSCVERYQREYERRLAPYRTRILKEAGLSPEIYEKSVEFHHAHEDFLHVVNAAFWFAQRQVLMLQKVTKISSHQYFTYLHHELSYFESYRQEIDQLAEKFPPEGRVYIVAKRVEDYVWKKTQLSFVDRLVFELQNLEEASKPHYQQLKEDINNHYESFDSTDRKKCVQILSHLNTEVSSTPRDGLLSKQKTFKGISPEDSTINHSKASTGVSKNISEGSGTARQINGVKLFTSKEGEILSESALQIGIKQENVTTLSATNWKEAEIKTEKGEQPPPKILLGNLKLIKDLNSPNNGNKRWLGDVELLKLLQQTHSSKHDFDVQAEFVLEELENRASEEEKTSSGYSQQTALEIFGQICFRAMENLRAILDKEREEKQQVFSDLSKWIKLDDKYDGIRQAELKKHEEAFFSETSLSKELYSQAFSLIEEDVNGADLIHFTFWSTLFAYKEHLRLKEGKEKTVLAIPAGELVDFYVWRERAIGQKAEMKVLKKTFQAPRIEFAVRERIKNFVEQHRKRPYEEYAYFIVKNPKLVEKYSGSHKSRFERTVTGALNSQYNTLNGTLRTMGKTENKKSCCQIF